MPKLTISDIAKMAGVGKSTVSRYLNGKGYVSEVAWKKIEAAIEESGYVPSVAAQNLSRKATGTIGLIIPEADNPFFASVLNGITDVADQNNLTLLLCNTNNSADKDLRALQIMQRQQVSGLIFTPAMEYHSSPLAQDVRRFIMALKCPVVILDRLLEDMDCDAVLSDNYGGAYDATRALIDAGHTRIGMVTGDLSLDIGRERLRGFQAALHDAKLSYNEEYIIPGEFDVEKTYQRTLEFFQRKDLPTAMFASNNLCSCGFFRAVHESGLSIPKDISYIGFDDVKGVNLFGNRYSFMERDVAGMGRQAMRVLLERMATPDRPSEQIYMPLSPRLYGSERMEP